MIEAAVIGAGPTGLLAAEAISRKGYRVTVFEEHKRVGYPVHCAGMVSVEGLKRLGIEASPVFHQNTVYGGRLFSSDGHCITIRDKKPRAYIIDRGRFDAYLADKALSSGANIETGRRVERFELGRDCWKLKIGSDTVSSKVIIDAEGARGRVLSQSGITLSKEGVIRGFNVELEVDAIEPDLVEVWFDNNSARGLFKWVIPLSEDRVRCGLATTQGDGVEALRRFVNKRFGVYPRGPIHGGLVCTGGPVKRTVYPGLILVGDVAGQTKPTTGGGVVIGGLCARLAGEVVVKRLETEAPGVLERYDPEWRSLFGLDLQKMLYFRWLLNQLDDAQVNQLFQAFIENGLEERLTALVQEGDMDMQAEVIKRAFSDPTIIGAAMKALGQIAVSRLMRLVGS